MKELTSAAANKWIRSLEDEKSYYLSLEDTASVYVLADGEEVEKPDYDYEQVSEAIAKIDEKIRKIRHAVNVFNATTVLEEIQITIDEALVKMAQLNIRKNKLDSMRRRLPKERVNPMLSRGKSFVEYEYTNYDNKKVLEDYKEFSKEIMNIQLALDKCNQTTTFSIELE
ncbi:hypothetical protein [Anaerosporobacter faecicola]|uniref:hypothetical protein n=1 Tax=Anaerosporobacter faecicola TaxID=2718714 RepID=UPI00143C6DE7|nr:hypothetical protein [Anaerosporobacter faecicola]